MERVREMDIMLAIGILYVVLGHNYQPSFIRFPAYAFQVAIFFFVSGYFFIPKFLFIEKIKWIKKKFIKLVVPYYILNLLFLLITIFLKTKNIYLGADPGWFDFFVTPFVNGHQYLLFSPAWFIMQLFITHVLFQFVYLSKSKYFLNILTVFLFILSLFAIFISYNNLDTIQIIMVRTVFSLLFYALGYIFYTNRDYLKMKLVNIQTVVFCLLAYFLLAKYFGPTSYQLVWAKFGSPYIFTPILGTLLCIIIFYNISCLLAWIFPKENFIYKIGQSTFAIMSFHLLIFFIINYFLFLIGLVSRESLSNEYYHYNVENIWYIYSGLGILIPTLVSLYYKRVIQRITHRVEKGVL